MIVGALAGEPLGVVVVEHDDAWAQALVSSIRERGWRADHLDGERLATGPAGALLSRLRPDIVLVDPTSVPEPAAAWVARLRGAVPGLSIVVCAGPSTAEQRIRALRLGVEHWLTKPVATEEVMATLEVVARHATDGAGAVTRGVVVAGELRIDPAAHMCTVDGAILRLTVKELGVLTCLAARRGRIVPREEVFARVWGWAMVDRDRTIDVYVRRLRAKLEQVSPGWSYIHTHKSRGYRFEAVPVHATSVPDDTRERRGTRS